MKQEEKTKLSYEKILNAAIIEFGENSYNSASLNAICTSNGISKGLLYHNFKNKDHLYLCCIRRCFEKMNEYLSKFSTLSDDAAANIQNVLNLRQQFFDEYPQYANLFYQVMFQQPDHLKKEIRKIRYQFDQYHADKFKELLSQIQLRNGISVDMAMEYFFLLQEMFNSHFQRKNLENTNVYDMIKNHENSISNFLNIMLYGIAQEK